MAEREGTTGEGPRGDRGAAHDTGARGLAERAPGGPPVPTVAELRDVNEQLLIAGLREQELAAALEAERAQLAVILAGIGDEARAELEAALQVAHRGEQECAQLLIRAEEAESAVQVRDDYLSAASHDLRTPLTSVM